MELLGRVMCAGVRAREAVEWCLCAQQDHVCLCAGARGACGRQGSSAILERRCQGRMPRRHPHLLLSPGHHAPHHLYHILTYFLRGHPHLVVAPGHRLQRPLTTCITPYPTSYLGHPQQLYYYCAPSSWLILHSITTSADQPPCHHLPGITDLVNTYHLPRSYLHSILGITYGSRHTPSHYILVITSHA